MAAFAGSVFAMEIDGKPIVAFEAKNFRETSVLSKEECFAESGNSLAPSSANEQSVHE